MVLNIMENVQHHDLWSTFVLTYQSHIICQYASTHPLWYFFGGEACEAVVVQLASLLPKWGKNRLTFSSAHPGQSLSLVGQEGSSNRLKNKTKKSLNPVLLFVFLSFLNNLSWPVNAILLNPSKSEKHKWDIYVYNVIRVRNTSMRNSYTGQQWISCSKSKSISPFFNHVVVLITLTKRGSSVTVMSK